LEYGTSNVAGQVLGGRWKPLHYWLKKSLFTDVLIACGVESKLTNSLWCYVRNDAPTPIVSNTLNIRAVNLTSGAASTVLLNNATFSLPAGPDSLRWIAVTLPAGVSPLTHVLIADLVDTRRNVITATNVQLLAAPYGLSGLSRDPLSLSIVANADQTADITVTKTSPNTALFVTLTTLANGRFSDNAFVMVDKSVTVKFISFDYELNIALLRSSLRVEHIGTYL